LRYPNELFSVYKEQFNTFDLLFTGWTGTQNWSDGILEYWNCGMMVLKKTKLKAQIIALLI